MEFHKIDNPAKLPKLTHEHGGIANWHQFSSAYYPNYAASARRFRELTQQEPGRVYEYTAPTPVGKAKYIMWYFEVTHGT